MESGAVHALPTGRHLAIDEQGVGLRLTWRLDRGFVNLSLWRHDRCVETFHLEPAAAADLVGFLVRGLSEASSVATAPVHQLAVVPDHEPRRARDRVAAALESAANRLRS